MDGIGNIAKAISRSSVPGQPKILANRVSRFRVLHQASTRGLIVAFCFSMALGSVYDPAFSTQIIGPDPPKNPITESTCRDYRKEATDFLKILYQRDRDTPLKGKQVAVGPCCEQRAQRAANGQKTPQGSHRWCSVAESKREIRETIACEELKLNNGFGECMDEVRRHKAQKNAEGTQGVDLR